MKKIQLQKISVAFGEREILKEVTLNLDSRSRAALAGVNGSGKSTLMKVIAGLLPPDGGERVVEKNCRVSYLPQAGDPAVVKNRRERTLREEAEAAFDPVRKLIAEKEAAGRALEATSRDDSRTARLLEEYHRLEEAVEEAGYHRRSERISQVLTGLGFSEADGDKSLEEFSGGWQMRAALARLLLESPDIILLDEPTNYLDIEARSWLEGWLEKTFAGGFLLVSHDRYFLDATVNAVYELFQGALKRYAGNFSRYEQVREAEVAALVKRYQEQEAEKAQAEALIRRFRYKASKAAMVQERLKMLEKLEARRVEIPESLKRLRVTLPPAPHSGRLVLTARGIGKAYGPRRVLENLDLDLEAGERLLVVGRNGAGKSTLLRILAGADLSFEGELRLGSGVVRGYFSQDAAETLQGGQTVLEYIEENAPLETLPRLRDLLGAFLFRGDDVYKSLAVLSGGEKSRLALLKILLEPVNLLILDEPTNHLDLPSKDLLLEALREYQGTVVFVSHDRGFMEALSAKTLELSSRGPEKSATARLFYGGYGYYLERFFPNEAADVFAGSVFPSGVFPSGAGNAAARAGGGAAAAGAQARAADKQRQAEERRKKRQEEKIMAELEALEMQKTALEGELAKPEVYSHAEAARQVQKQIAETQAQIDRKTAEWEGL